MRSVISRAIIRRISLHSLDKTRPFLEGLSELVHEHRDYEYQVEYYAGYKDTLLVGASLRSKVPYGERNEMKQMEQFPLHDVWENYIQHAEFNSVELMQLYMAIQLGEFNGNLSDHYSYFREQYDYDELQKIPLLEGWRKSFAERIYPLDDIESCSRCWIR